MNGMENDRYLEIEAMVEDFNLRNEKKIFYTMFFDLDKQDREMQEAVLRFMAEKQLALEELNEWASAAKMEALEDGEIQEAEEIKRELGGRG